MTRLQIFCEIDDFCLWFVPVWESRMLPPADHKVRRRKGQLCLSEIMTILIMFHSSNFRTFKHFYLMVESKHRAEFPEFKIAVFSAWWMTAGQLVPEGTFEVWGGLGHGGEGETSMMLRVDPNLVDMDKAQGILPDLPPHIELKWLFHEITPYGVTGDPTKATHEKGRLMNDAMVNLLVDLVEAFDEKDWKLLH